LSGVLKGTTALKKGESLAVALLFPSQVLAWSGSTDPAFCGLSLLLFE